MEQQNSNAVATVTITEQNHEKLYMNTATGSVDDYDGWWYENDSGEKVNAVDLGEVVEVVRCDGGYYCQPNDA